MDQYELAMMYKSQDIRDHIYSKRAIVLTRLDMYINYPIVAYHAEQDANMTGFYNPTVEAGADGIFDLKLYNGDILIKDMLMRMFGLNPNDRYYFSIDNVFVDINSNQIQYWIESMKSAKIILDMEFEEFLLYVEENLGDYLLCYPEDNIYEGGQL